MRLLASLRLASNGPGTELPFRLWDLDSLKRCIAAESIPSLIQTWSRVGKKPCWTARRHTSGPIDMEGHPPLLGNYLKLARRILTYSLLPTGEVRKDGGRLRKIETGC